MDRRTVKRVKRRINCEFFHKGRPNKGIVLDFSSSGLFIRTNTIISPGTELDVELQESLAAPAMSLRVSVARRRSVPANLVTILNPGLGARILEAPVEYGLLTGQGLLDAPIRRGRPTTAPAGSEPASAITPKAEPGQGASVGSDSPKAPKAEGADPASKRRERARRRRSREPDELPTRFALGEPEPDTASAEIDELPARIALGGPESDAAGAEVPPRKIALGEPESDAARAEAPPRKIALGEPDLDPPPAGVNKPGSAPGVASAGSSSAGGTCTPRTSGQPVALGGSEPDFESPRDALGATAGSAATAGTAASAEVPLGASSANPHAESARSGPAAGGAPTGKSQRSQRTSRAPDPRATAVLVGGGDLDEVTELLADLGVDSVHCAPDDPQLGDLSGSRLLVVSAGLAVGGQLTLGDKGLVNIAVGADVSEGERAFLRQQGYDYLVRQPVHLEALRMLLLHSLYQERDRRRHPRYPVGYEVDWRAGPKRGRAPLLDISMEGFRLLMSESPPLDSGLAIRIPAEIADGQPLKLEGGVIRCTPNAVPSGPERTAVAATFDDLAPALRQRLHDFCERLADGPLTLPDAPSKTDSPPNAPDAGALYAADDSSTSSPERRRSKRGIFNQEVIQVDVNARAVQVLLGRDLSSGGIRVDSRGPLAEGEKLELEIFDSSQGQSLAVSAVVRRDYGEGSWGLQFVGLSRETQARISTIVASLSPVESLQAGGNDGVLPTRIVSRDSGDPTR